MGQGISRSPQLGSRYRHDNPVLLGLNFTNFWTATTVTSHSTVPDHLGMPRKGFLHPSSLDLRGLSQSYGRNIRFLSCPLGTYLTYLPCSYGRNIRFLQKANQTNQPPTELLQMQSLKRPPVTPRSCSI